MKTPEFKQPEITEKPEYLTREGFDNLKKEVEELKKERQEIAIRIEEARGLGDLSENAEYLTAKERQGFVQQEIDEKEGALSNAVIITPEHTADIRLGSSISLKKENGEEEKYMVVGPKEPNLLSDGKISYESPLGAALIGKKKDDKVEIATPNGKIIYTITDVG